MRFVFLIVALLVSLSAKAQAVGLDQVIIVDTQFKAALASYGPRKQYNRLVEIEFDDHINVDNCPDYLKAISESRKLTGYQYNSWISYAYCVIDHAVFHSSGLETVTDFPEDRGDVLAKRMDMSNMKFYDRPDVMPEIVTLETMFPDRVSGYRNHAGGGRGSYAGYSIDIVAIVDVNHNGKEDWIIRYENQETLYSPKIMSGTKIILDVTETGLLTPIDYRALDYERNNPQPSNNKASSQHEK